MLFKLNHEFYKQTNLAHQLSVMMSVLVAQLINITDAIFSGMSGNRTGSSAIAGNNHISPLRTGLGSVSACK
ncbi:MAG: hypothetical protein ACLU4N_29295 [Butyricimonas faecihominis]